MLAVLSAAVVGPPARAAVSPVTWCGGTASASDRPDVVGGNQIHVIYAAPSDGPDRFMQVASPIATDIGAIASWWRTQDSTRAPRFDLAGFPCSGAGSLDISDVKLPHPAAFYNQTATPRLQLLRDDLLAAGFDDPAKKYLVYYDQPQPAAGTDCGAAYVNAQSGGAHGYAAVYIAPNLETSAASRGCGSIEAGSARGAYLAVVAAHELVNQLGALDPAAPHRCAGDPLHVCDNTLDVLAPTPTATTLATALLDYGHDDYYAHSGSWWDVQDSAWLSRLDAGEHRVRVTVGDGGRWVVDTAQPSLLCASPACSWTWQDGSELKLSATAAAGYRFLRWTGCPSVQGEICSLTVDATQRVGAVFARPLRAVGFHLSLSRDRLRLTATVHLDAAGRADLLVCTFARQKVVASSLHGRLATCTWSVPSRFRGHLVRGKVELASKGETLLTRPFHVRVPARRS